MRHHVKATVRSRQSPPRAGRRTGSGDRGRWSRFPCIGHRERSAAISAETPPGLQRRSEAHEDDREAGFTLVELLVVLVILGLVMGLVGPRVLGYLSSSRERTMRLQIESFTSALDLYYLDMGRYPTNAEGLEALVKAPAGNAGRWAGPYLKQPQVPEDPWGNAYQYHVPGRSSPYTIVSLGPDGKGGANAQQADSRSP